METKIDHQDQSRAQAMDETPLGFRLCQKVTKGRSPSLANPHLQRAILTTTFLETWPMQLLHRSNHRLLQPKDRLLIWERINTEARARLCLIVWNGIIIIKFI